MTGPSSPAPAPVVDPPVPTPARPGQAVGTEVKRHLEALPLRVRLVAVMVVLLLLALTLTAAATAALMRRDLMSRVDDDLKRASPIVAQQALNTLRAPTRNRLPSGYAVVFYPTDDTPAVEIDPTGAVIRPGVPDTLPLDDPRVTSL